MKVQVTESGTWRRTLEIEAPAEDVRPLTRADVGPVELREPDRRADIALATPALRLIKCAGIVVNGRAFCYTFGGRGDPIHVNQVLSQRREPASRGRTPRRWPAAQRVRVQRVFPARLA